MRLNRVKIYVYPSKFEKEGQHKLSPAVICQVQKSKELEIFLAINTKKDNTKETQ